VVPVNVICHCPNEVAVNLYRSGYLFDEAIYIPKTAFTFWVIDVAGTVSGFYFFGDFKRGCGLPCPDYLLFDSSTSPVIAVADIDILAFVFDKHFYLNIINSKVWHSLI
jgi:hypothetical protein